MSDICFPFSQRAAIDAAAHVAGNSGDIHLYQLARVLYYAERESWREHQYYMIGGHPVVSQHRALIQEFLDMAEQRLKSNWYKHFSVNNGIVALEMSPSGDSLSPHFMELLDSGLEHIQNDDDFSLPEDLENGPITMKRMAQILNAKDLIKNIEEEIHIKSILGRKNMLGS